MREIGTKTGTMNILGKIIRWGVLSGPAASLLVFVSSAQAQVDTGITPLSSTGGVVKVMGNVLNTMFYVLIAVSVIMVLWAAFLYVTAGDDPKKPSEAKMLLLYAAIGLIVGLLAKGIPCVLGSIFNADVPGCGG